MSGLMRDEKGRPVAADGWPIDGCANVREVVAVSSLSRSKIYELMTSGTLPTVCFGKSRRVRWSDVRRLFLSGNGGVQ